MTHIVALLQELAKHGIKLAVKGEKLQVDAPKGALTADLRDRIVAVKPELIDFLGKHSSKPALAPIVPRPDTHGPMPLSFSQIRLWFLDRMDGGNAAYNILLAVRLTGKLNRMALTRALTEIVRRHDSLRTTFTEENGQPVGELHPAHPIFIEEMDLTGTPESSLKEELRRLATAETARPFDISLSPPWRVTLIDLAKDDYALMVTQHHIISDAWSVGVITQELAALYTAFSAGKPSPLPPLSIQYADYAWWQQKHLAGDELNRQLAFWKQRLAGAEPLLELPLDYPRPPVQSSRGAKEEMLFTPKLVSRIEALSKEAGGTLFMTMLSVWSLLLSRYAGSEDVVLGSPIANRNRRELEPLIGMFVNTLVLRVDLSGNPSFRELIRRIRDTTAEASSHQDLPFDRLVEELQVPRELSYTPVFQVMFALQTTPGSSLQLPELELKALSADEYTAKFDLSLHLEHGPKSGSIVGRLEYRTELFKPETIQAMVRFYQRIVEEISVDPNQPIAQISLLSDAERSRLKTICNGGERLLPSATTLHGLFFDQAARTPDADALVLHETGEPISYAALAAQVSRLAHLLRSKGMKPGNRVAIALPRSQDMIAAIPAVPATGAAYVALDISYPAERLKTMTHEMAVDLVLTISDLENILDPDLPKVFLDREDLNTQAAAVPTWDVDAGLPVFIAGTSGSTGRPKGVMSHHRGVVNFLGFIHDTVKPGPSDTVLQIPKINFDASVRDIMGTLTSGARLVVVSEQDAQQPNALVSAMRAHKVTAILSVVPGFLAHLLDAAQATETDQQLRVVLSSGEVLRGSMVARIHETFGEQVKVINLYGPTETALTTTFYPAGHAESGPMPVGRPIPGAALYVTDGLVQQPAGMPGDILIGGEGVSYGYVGRPGLTAQVFRPDPFSGQPGARLYDTGDRGRFRPDGVLLYMGRRDHQVKVRGVRLELGAVEAALTALPGVQRAAVLLRDSDLVAYVITDEGHDRNPADLREQLSQVLPAHAVPTYFVFMDSFPLLPNGKLNRRELPDPERHAATHIPPRDAVEEELVGIWSDVLGVADVGVMDDFFALGGFSLLAVQVLARIRDRFDVDLPVRLLFTNPTVAGLALTIRQNKDRAERSRSLPPIEPVDRNQPLPLSFSQQRLWFLDQLEGPGAAYNMIMPLRLEGDLNTGALERALGLVVYRHESLRTRFGADDAGNPHQIIDEPAPFFLRQTDLRGEDNVEDLARKAADEEARLPFNLAEGPLFRAHLIRLEDQNHILLIMMHHIVSDGWSLGVVVRELTQAYTAYAAGKEAEFHALEVQYADYAVWQREVMTGGRLAQLEDFWRTQLTGAPALLELPTDRPRPAVQNYAGAVSHFRIDGPVTRDLERLGRGLGATLFMTLEAAFAVLMYRMSGQDDVLIGTPSANRGDAKLEPMIGFFVNSLVLRHDLASDPSFTDFLARVRNTAMDAFSHAELPFEQVIELAGVPRTMAHNPLFQVQFILQNQQREGQEIPDLKISHAHAEQGTARFDLTLSLTPMEGALMGVVEYRTDLFDSSTMRRLVRAYQHLLRTITHVPDQQVSKLPLMKEGERSHLITAWNNTGASVSDTSLHQLIAEQAEATPDLPAVVFDGDEEREQLTYTDLMGRAGYLAHYLRRLGAGPEVPVAVCIDRSADLVIALLAVLQTGAYYVPIDPAYPWERQVFMLQDTKAPLLLAQSERAGDMPDHDGETVAVDTVILRKGRAQPPTISVDQGNAAYMIYTSGSTGKPKGVINVHGAIVNRLEWMQHTYKLAGSDRVLQKTPFSFDVSVWEFFWPLLAGAGLVVAQPGRHGEPAYLADLIRREKVTTVHFVPSMLNAFLSDPATQGLPSMRRVICSGEALSQDARNRFFARYGKHLLLENLYGPTEAAVDVTRHACRPEETGGVPIGRPIANMVCHVLDQHMEPVPLGVPGELFLGGIGLARGYAGRAGLTAEKFVPDPFSADLFVSEGARLYRTGDRCRVIQTGQGETIEFLGRFDFQVKLRGFRIELGEIEAALSVLEGVDAAVVVVREDTPGDQRLVGYVQTESDILKDAQHLRGKLSELPEYMIPHTWVFLDAMPLSANGKLNRKALPAPEYRAAEFVAPRGEIEAGLAEIWAEVLNVEQVGAEDDFFAMGGHSLLATQVVTRIRDRFNVNLQIRDLFTHTRLKGLAEMVASGGSKDGGPAQPVVTAMERPEHLPLSFAQQRLYFLDRLEGANPVYNMTYGLDMTGPLDLPALQAALTQLVARHESLRTNFLTHDGVPVQRIHPPAPFAISITDVSAAADPDAALETAAREEAAKTFDLAEDSLLRVVIVRRGPAHHAMFLTLHHIIADGWSLGVVVNELSALYKAQLEHADAALPPMPLQMVDVALWQQNVLGEEGMAQQLAFWRKTLAGAPALITLPTDRPRPRMQTYNGRNHRFIVDPDTTAALANLARINGATLFMVLETALALVLSRYSGQDEVVIGTPVAGRTQRELETLIGPFINNLALRNDVSGNPRFIALLERVKRTALDAFDHAHVPFERVVDAVQPERSLSHSPVFQTFFILQNAPGGNLDMPGLTVGRMEADKSVARFDLSLAMTETPQGLHGAFEYNTDLFDEDTVSGLARNLVNLLANAVASPDLPIADLDMLGTSLVSLRRDWREPAVDYPRHTAYHRLFEDSAEKHRDHVALICGDESLSYSDLNEAANRLAHHLIAEGVTPEQPVAVFCDRGAEMLIALLGIMKAGGAYVPLDPLFPADRLAYMLDDADVRLVLTQRALLPDVPSGARKTILLDRAAGNADHTAVKQRPIHNPGVAMSSENLAYIIYTSGSTGKPKGVQLCHRTLVNFLCTMAQQPGLTAEDTLLAVTTISFDIAGLELYLPLMLSGRLVLADKATTRDGALLLQAIKDHGVTAMQATPATWRLMLEHGELPPLKKLCGGEALPMELSARLVQTQGDLWNMYGPTETTIWSSVYRVPTTEETREGSLPEPIGKPIANTSIYVLDRHGRVLPHGAAGELYIGGEGLARGYRGRYDLTAERFLPDPYSTTEGDRMYRTGDLARFRKDGVLEFLGRVDHQAKLHGFRIELGEIETVLAEYKEVDIAVVLLRDERLIGYVTRPPGVTEDDNPFSVNEARRFLETKLPSYMVPSVFVPLEQFPLTPNGKIDRKALPDPGAVEGENEFVPARNPTEEILAQVWSEVLGVPEVGIYDNYFELGGDSVLSIRVIDKANQAGVAITAKQLFECRHIAALAEVAGNADADGIDLSIPLTDVERSVVETLVDDPQKIEDFYGLSPMQTGMLYHTLYEGQREAYFEQLSWQLGAMNVARFQRAWETVFYRYPNLRSSYHWGELVEPVQIIHSDVRSPWEEHDWTDMPADYDEIARRLSALRRADIDRGFDLHKPPLMRLSLIRLPGNNHYFIWFHHHLLMDGWARANVLREVYALYGAYTEGRDLALEPIRPYRNYIAWLKQQDMDAARRHWQNLLDGFKVPTAIMGDKGAAAAAGRHATHAGEALELSVGLTAKLKKLARKHRVTLNTLVQGIWALQLSRYSGSRDVVFGATVSGRPPQIPGVDRMVGLFINSLPVRVQIPETGSLMPVMRVIQDGQTEQLPFAYTPLTEIHGWSEVPRDLPLYDSLIVFNNYPVDDTIGEGTGFLETGAYEFFTQTTYAMTLVANPGKRLVMVSSYDPDRFEQKVMARIMGHFRSICQALVEDSEMPVQQVTLLSEKERQQLMASNQTTAPYTTDQCMHQLFEARAEAAPNLPAVYHRNGQLSYGELETAANRLAHLLAARGVQPHQNVGVCLRRTLDMPVALLAIHKLGAAYVPMEAAWPADRIAFVLKDVAAPVFITHSCIAERVGDMPVDTLCMDQTDTSTYPPTRPDITHDSGRLAYIIFTSGSTGKPKGVVLRHRPVINLIEWVNQTYQVGPGDKLLFVTALSFDLSVYDVFGTLASGAAFYIADEEQLSDPDNVVQVIQDEHITFWDSAPAALQRLTRSFPEAGKGVPSLRLVFMSGDWIPLTIHGELTTAWPNVKVVGLGGATEAAIWSNFHNIEEIKPNWRSIPYGVPIQNARYYVLDEHLHPCPVGVAGDLYIGGNCLSMGYHKQPQLSAERYKPDPYAVEPGGIMYTTGDRARFMGDDAGGLGEIEFLGRLDNQVKVRGFRIELGEIESVLEQHPDIREGVVLAREDSLGDKRLVAYVVPAKGKTAHEGSLEVPALRRHLNKQLPEYMLPGIFVFLDHMPVSANGKLDRKALPAPAAEDVRPRATLAEPTTETEKVLAEIWEHLLDVRPIGIHDNFFDLGGHSLMAVQLSGRIQQALGSHVPLASLLETPTIATLGASLDGDGDSSVSSLVPIQPEGDKEPFYCVHPVGGNVLCYMELSRLLGPDQPFYGLQSRTLFDEAPDETIEAMADHYVAVLRRHKPQGPYRIGGWSLGGLISFAMATRLREMGEEVSHLVLMDSHIYDESNIPQHVDDAQLLVLFARDLGAFAGRVPAYSAADLRRLNSEERFHHILEFARHLNILSGTDGPDQLRRLWLTFKNNLLAGYQFTPTSYDGEVTLFPATQWAGSSVRRDPKQWEPVSGGGMVIRDVPGDHYSMFQQPNVRALADALRTVLASPTL